MSARTMAGWLEENRVTLVKTWGPHMARTPDDDPNRGWEHYAYRLKFVMQESGGRVIRETPEFDYRMGVGHDPVDVPDAPSVLDAIVSDAGSYENTRSFEDFAAEYGFDRDSRWAERTYLQCGEVLKWLTTFVGGEAEMQHLLYKTERG